MNYAVLLQTYIFMTLSAQRYFMTASTSRPKGKNANTSSVDTSIHKTRWHFFFFKYYVVRFIFGSSGLSMNIFVPAKGTTHYFNGALLGAVQSTYIQAHL